MIRDQSHARFSFLFQVIHDCRNESSTLWTQFGIRLENVFDTQVRQQGISFNQLFEILVF